MAQRKTAAPPEAPRVYPSIELFLENNGREAVSARFAGARDALEGLPKAKAEHAKRALVALTQTEELLNLLFDNKERLEQASKKTRR